MTPEQRDFLEKSRAEILEYDKLSNEIFQKAAVMLNIPEKSVQEDYLFDYLYNGFNIESIFAK